MSQFCTAAVRAPEPERLLQLRAKTDRQLLDFINTKLDVGLSLAVLAGADNRKLVERVVSEIQNLMPALRDHQRREVEPKLHELRARLDRLRDIGTQFSFRHATS